MCRAVGVPARVIVGLVYVEDQGAFGYHMWNEVYVNRRWVAIDATSNQAQVDATHLKVADASLDGVSPYETFLSLARSASNLSLVPSRNPLRLAPVSTPHDPLVQPHSAA